MEEKENQIALRQKKKNKAFLKNKKQEHQQQFEDEKKTREHVQKREVELVEKEKLKQQKMKQEMEGFLHKNKETRNIDVKERKEIDDFYNTQLVSDLIDMYSEPLMHLYKYYTLQGNISLGGNLEKRMNVIEFTNWVKFGTCTNITPHLMTSKDMEVIYRLLERDMMSVEEEKQEDEKEDKDINYIDFEHFKKGLIRITILSKTQSIEHEIKKRRIQPKSQSTAKVSPHIGDKNKTNK
jgi:hypothetical protein